MGLLDVLAAAHDAYTQRRIQQIQHPTPPQPPGSPSICRRCGCDTTTCREGGCIEQPDPQTEDSLNSPYSPYRYIPETRYSHGMKDTR